MNELSQCLNSIVECVESQFTALDDNSVRQKPNPERWAKIEILGHLIDSACNNHRRFVVAQGNTELIFDGYDQEAWVRHQNYLNGDWQDIVAMWATYNRHLAALIEEIPETVLVCPRTKHCLHQIAWRPIPQNEPATLQYFIQDYIGHLEHHLRQILPDYQPVMMGTYEYMPH